MKLKDVIDYVSIDPRKLTEYALNLDNPKGRDKALMFQRHLGFTKDNYQPLLEQIETKVLNAEASLQRTDVHGRRYQVDLQVNGVKQGQTEVVRTGWIIEPNTNVARLVTLYVRKRK
ncbi:DUF6883 domain-containing protein [Myxosarcina sp. GI1]|uniref:DUF6883 domain-containing protein n=1 Tax=Myxosarcina sp. GI1 TaxID=1541065 RepID=UPI00056B8196|nr:DUF6883 domain-containing protein [Myxosarcina sp. GI1]